MKLNNYDILVILAVFLMIGTHFVTVAVISHQVEVTKADYDKVVEVREQNPFTKWQIAITGFAAILRLIIIPAMVWGSYWVIRRVSGERSVSVQLVAQFFFMVALLNILNDLGVYVGLIL